MTAPTQKRESWSNRLGFILATTGAAVGLGNIWKFPYMAGDNGGSAFVLVYLLCVFLIGLPIMLSEMLIGRHRRSNVVTAMHDAATEAKSSPAWQLVGWLGAATLILILSFYSVVAGWSISYMFHAFGGAFNGLQAHQIFFKWQNFLAHPIDMLCWDTVFMVLTMSVVALGVKRGLERVSDILMPALFFILVILTGYALATDGFKAAFKFLFDFNFHKLTVDVIISAMGHAFFTLATGAGCMLVYGSYAKDDVKLTSSVLVIAGLDILVAIFAGLAIFPIVFTYHLTPQGGPGLMFQILPIAFSKMPGGQLFGGLFFVLLLFAAWTSSISLGEPLVILLTERWNLDRKTAATLIGLLAWILSIGSVLSFNIWQHAKLFGHWSFFTAITDLVTNFMLPIGGICFSIFAGWIMHESVTRKELNTSEWLFKTWRFLARYIAPIGILIIILGAVL